MSAVDSSLHRVVYSVSSREDEVLGYENGHSTPMNDLNNNGLQESSVFLQRQKLCASTPKHRGLAGAGAAHVLVHEYSTLWKPSENKEKIKCFKMWAQRKSKLTSNKRLIFFSHREVSATYSSWQGSVSKGNLTKLHKDLAGWLWKYRASYLNKSWPQLLQILKELFLCLSNICFVSKQTCWNTSGAHDMLQLMGQSQEAGNGNFFHLASEIWCPVSVSDGQIGPNPSVLNWPVPFLRKRASVVQALISVSGKL